MRPARLEAFSDGVFAVAITLLVLDLQVPAGSASLLHDLADRWPTFAAFALTFLIIGIIWVNHHAIFGSLRTVDRPLLFINLGLLIAVVVMPFTTTVLAHYMLLGGPDAHLAAALFAGSSLLMALAFNVIYFWIELHPQLRHDPTPRRLPVRDALRFALGLAGYVLALLLSFVSALLVFLTCIALALYYVVDQATGRDLVDDSTS